MCLVHRVVRDGWTAPETAGTFSVRERTVRNWLARYRADGARLWSASDSARWQVFASAEKWPDSTHG